MSHESQAHDPSAPDYPSTSLRAGGGTSPASLGRSMKSARGNRKIGSVIDPHRPDIRNVLRLEGHRRPA